MWVFSFPNPTRKTDTPRIHSQQKCPPGRKGNEVPSVPDGGTWKERVTPAEGFRASSKQKGDNKRRAWGPGKESEHDREYVSADSGLFGSFSIIKRKERAKCVAPT